MTSADTESLETRNKMIARITRKFEASEWRTTIRMAIQKGKYQCELVIPDKYQHDIDPYIYASCEARINNIIHETFPDVLVMYIDFVEVKGWRIIFSWKHLKPTSSCLLL